MRRVIASIRNYLEYLPVLCAYHCVRIMPRFALETLAAGGGRVMYAIPPFRRLAMANIMTAFPDIESREARRICRESFINLTRTLLELFWFANSPARLDRYVHITPESAEMIKSHIAAGESIIFVTPHLGNWEAIGLRMAASSGLDFAAVVRPPRNPLINKLIRDSREVFGSEIIDAKGAGRDMLRAVKRGKSMATLIDQNTRIRDGGVFVKFFGLPVPSSRAPSIFAKMKNVRVYVGGGVRSADHHIHTFHQALSKPTDQYVDDTEMIQELISITETYVRKHPEQYLWFYKRFQYIPPDTDEALRSRYPYYAGPAPEKFFYKRKET